MTQSGGGVWRDKTGQYVLKVGQDEEVRLFVRVRNRGEDAHEAAVNIVLPPLMEYLGTDSEVSPVWVLWERFKIIRLQSLASWNKAIAVVN